ncbi:MAG: acyl-CoA dehydrogenase family protein [Deltaproteobacteria bacterium]|nr:acyl-CoA dehydrogenase family protein [Deltaproteobacteria bacterium]
MIKRTVYQAEHEQFRDSVRRFLAAEVVPCHEQWESDGQVDRALWNKAGEQGLLCPTVPEEYGGVSADFRYNAIIDEEIATLQLSGLGWAVHSDIAVPYMLHYCSEELKQKFLPGCVTGEIVTAISMTEPGAGSDLQGITTTAVKDGDDYVINGSKTFVTNGQHADLVIVVAKTDPEAGAAGTSLVLVEADRPGFERGSNLKKIGMKAQDTSELFFNDLRVPRSNLMGNEGEGFVYLMQELPQERLSVAISGITASEAVLGYTVDYVKERQAFGRPLAAFQNTQFKLAELDTEITSARVFVDRCLELHVDGELDVPTAAKAKLLVSELQGRVVDECVQLHGGYGYMSEYPVARAYVDARIQRIFAGSSEVMKIIISRALMG